MLFGTLAPIGEVLAQDFENENSHNNEENIGCSDINLSLSIASGEKTKYYGTDLIESSVLIDGKGIVGEAKGLYYDLIFPSEEFPIRGDRNWDPIDITRWEDPANQGKYIDSSSTIKEYPLIDKVEKRVEPGKTIYRVYLKSIDSTTTLKIPYTFSFKDNITPADYKFQPEVKLYDANGCLIKEAKDKEYSIKYDGFEAKKLVNLSTAQNQMNYAGTKDKNHPDRVSEDDTRPVTFHFRFDAINGGYKGARARALESYKITDTLPTYTDAKGNQRTAEFRPEENSGWVLSEDGKTVSFNLNERKRVKLPHGEYLDISSGGDLYEEGVQLNLRFPGAKINSKTDKEKDRVYYKNSAEISAVPYNPGQGEIYKDSSNISIQLTADSSGGSQLFWKINTYDNGVRSPESAAKTFYDKSGMATAEVNYSMYLKNTLFEPMKDIVMIEDAKDFDPRFYISAIGTPEQTYPTRKILDVSQFEIRAIKKDGTYDVITERLYNYREHPINKKAQEEAKKIRRQVLDGAIQREDTPVLSPEYDRVEIHFKNFELPVGAEIRLNVKMKYKDPFKIEYEPGRALNNKAEVNFKSGKNEQKLYTSADKFLTPIEENVHLFKETNYLGNSSPKVGDKVRFDIIYDFKGLSDQREITNLTFVDLLPEGITVDKETSNLSFPNNSGKEYNHTVEIVNNYNNTGRNAFIIKFGKFLVGDHTSVHGKDFRFNFTGRINENIVPEKAITEKLNNDNTIYSYFNDDQSVLVPTVGDSKSYTVVKDNLDINQNGKSDDSILMAKSTVKSTLAQSIRSVKRIRSLEPIEENGELVYDRTFSLDTTTKYADKDNDKSGRFEYQLRVNNYIDEKLNKLEIYDIIPGFIEGDDKYNNKLVDEIKVYKANEDVTSGFDIYYTTDKNPSKDPLEAVNNQNWVKNPTSYEDVTAIKIVSSTQPVLGDYETLDVRIQMKAPEHPGSNLLSEEVATNSFYVRYSDKGKFGLSNPVTNRLARKIAINVEKIWDDKDNKYEKRPDEITVKLLANGVETNKKLVLSENNKWTDIFTNLSEYDNNEAKIKYSVKEVGEEDNKLIIGDTKYGVSYSGDSEKGFTITNKLEQTSIPWTPMEPSKIDIKVNKIWQDKEGEEIDAPVDKIEVELYRDDQTTGEVLELNKENNWTGEIKDLDVQEKVDSEKAYVYTVKEVGEEKGSVQLSEKWFNVNYEGSMVDGYTITNKESKVWTPMEVPHREVKVSKVFTNFNGEVIDSPVDSIEVELYQDGETTGETKTLNAENDWSATFEDLPAYESLENTEAFNYTVKEVGESAGSIQLSDKWFNVTYEGSMVDGYTITNKESKVWTPMEVPHREVKVRKEFTNFNGEVIDSPVDSIQVELYKDGETTGKTKTLNAENDWSATFEELPAYKSLEDTTPFNYTVKEVGESAGSVQLSGKWFNVNYEGSMTDGFTITNKESKVWTPMEVPHREVKVRKVFTNFDGNAIESPVDSIQVELYKDGEATGEKRTLSADNNWNTTFEELPVYESLENTTPFNYTVKELGESGNSINLEDKWFNVSYNGDMKEGYIITNKETRPWTPMEVPTREVKVRKKFTDFNGNAIESPVDSIEVELYRDGEATGLKQILNPENNWSVTFEKLPAYESLENTVPFNYTVKEVGEVECSVKLSEKWFNVSYEGSMTEGFTITNKESKSLTPMEIPHRNLKVSKTWTVKADDKPVDKIEVELYRDGKATGIKLTLSEENNWNGVFENLPVYESLENTKPYEYTVKEIGEEDGKVKLSDKTFEVRYEGSMKDGFEIINKELEEKIPETKDKDKTNPKTGDSFNGYLYIGLALSSAGILAILNSKKRKNYNK